MNNIRFEQQIEFILEMDKLKSVFRRSYVLGTDRSLIQKTILRLLRSGWLPRGFFLLHG